MFAALSVCFQTCLSRLIQGNLIILFIREMKWGMTNQIYLINQRNSLILHYNRYDCGAIALSIKIYWLAAHKNFDFFSFQKSFKQPLKSKRWLWEHLKNVIVNRDISNYKGCCRLEINNFFALTLSPQYYEYTFARIWCRAYTVLWVLFLIGNFLLI